MKLRVAAQGLLLTATVLVLFLAFSYLMFPAARIDAVINQVLARQGLTLAPGVSKTLLPGLAWNQPVLASDQGALLRCNSLKLRVQLLPLLMGRLACAGRMEIGAGHGEISYAVNGSNAARLAIADIALSDIPFFATVLGAKVTGTLWSQGELQRSGKGVSGEIRVAVPRLELSGVKLGAFPLPDAANLKTQGMIKVTDGRARLESFTLEADGVYMRLSGDLPSGSNAGAEPLNLSLDIMPKPDFLEKQKLVFMLLTKFMVSPGVYRLPIRGTLVKPQIL